MRGKDILYILLILLILYFISQCIGYYNIETFQSMETFEDYNKPNLTPMITENGCLPPQKDCQYSYQVNRNYCFNNLFCPNKDDQCVNQHCVPQGMPAPSDVTQQCNGCAPPGLIPQNE